MLPATLTVSFRELHPIKVTKLQRPGLLRVTNDNSRTVRFLYGDFRRPRPDGRTRVLAHDSVVVRVHRRTIDWVAFFGNFRVLVGIGTCVASSFPPAPQPGVGPGPPSAGSG